MSDVPTLIYYRFRAYSNVKFKHVAVLNGCDYCRKIPEALNYVNPAKMHVRVRIFGKPDTIVVVESKLTKIEEFRMIIKNKFDVPPTSQRLFYGGKLLENGYNFHDYNIKLNDVIQLLIKLQPDEGSADHNTSRKSKETNEDKSNRKGILYKDAKSTLYAIGDLIDVKDSSSGAWLESKIDRIVLNPDEEFKVEVGTLSNGQNTSNLEQSDNKENHTIISPEATNNESQNIKQKGISKYFNKIPRFKNAVKENKRKEMSKDIEDILLFKVQLDGEYLYSKYTDIRPRARTELNIKDLTTGQIVMINHNIDDPLEKGLWYDFQIDEIVKRKKVYELLGTLFLGQDAIPQNDTTVKVLDKIFAIENVVPLQERTEEYKKIISIAPEKRSQPLNCMTCRDDFDLPCQDCGCYLCFGKEEPENTLLCDECNYGFHMKCLSPPVTEIPDEDWYCPSCKRDQTNVIAPGAATQTKKTSTSKSNKDWGRGMACVGKTKTCVMPPNHFGPIPGIEVGMCWRFRIQLSESGVHRPPVSGIHGRDVEGAYSIVLSGGYEDDVDHGNEFTYSGSGGRDLSGNKRTAEQSCDQTLGRENKALARNCAVKLDESGGDAGDNWRLGKPVRVVRSYKMLKHFPKYAPKEGIRYDGIYKVVKYYPEKGLSGYRVWKYLLRRDDPSPAPWEPGAKHYTIIYPDGYLEAEAEKKALREKSSSKSAKGTRKRALQESNQSIEPDDSPLTKKRKSADDITITTRGSKRTQKNSQSSTNMFKIPKNIPPKAKPKREVYADRSDSALSDHETAAVRADVVNAKLWNECLEVCEKKTKSDFIEYVTQVFLCIICQDVAVNPVTTPCLHNFCLGCIKLAFKSTESQTCPYCRNPLNKEDLQVNENLRAALQAILAGYDAGKK